MSNNLFRCVVLVLGFLLSSQAHADFESYMLWDKLPSCEAQDGVAAVDCFDSVMAETCERLVGEDKTNCKLAGQIALDSLAGKKLAVQTELSRRAAAAEAARLQRAELEAARAQLAEVQALQAALQAQLAARTTAVFERVVAESMVVEPEPTSREVRRMVPEATPDQLVYLSDRGSMAAIRDLGYKTEGRRVAYVLYVNGSSTPSHVKEDVAGWCEAVDLDRSGRIDDSEICVPTVGVENGTIYVPENALIPGKASALLIRIEWISDAWRPVSWSKKIFDFAVNPHPWVMAGENPHLY